MLPDFLGIGVPKAGSTWLLGLLESHPEIGVPPDRREVQFFESGFGAFAPVVRTLLSFGR
jgi:hypothetical protein